MLRTMGISSSVEMVECWSASYSLDLNLGILFLLCIEIQASTFVIRCLARRLFCIVWLLRGLEINLNGWIVYTPLCVVFLLVCVLQCCCARLFGAFYLCPLTVQLVVLHVMSSMSFIGIIPVLQQSLCFCLSMGARCH